MSSIVFLLCLLSVVRSVDLRASPQRRIRNDDFMIRELFQNKEDGWKENSDETYDTSEPRIPKIWKTVQDSSYNHPCITKTRQWKTNEYLPNQRQYDFQPDEIRVKHCVGGSSNDVVKQGCLNVMDCVTQYERRKFIRKPKGTDCTQWHVFEKNIPVGCECMLAT